MEPLINKIANSGLITLDLENFLPKDFKITGFDIKPFLFEGIMLKEKDFRQALLSVDWQQFTQKNVAVFCSADAILPAWTYMLVAVRLEGIANQIFQGFPKLWKEILLLQQIEKADISAYKDERVILKGCGREPIPESALVAMSVRLRPVVKSLMFGEPCSTVPVYKKNSKTI